MARIIIMTSGLRGILNASFELANRLESAGHEVTLAAPRDGGEKERFDFLRLPDYVQNPAPEVPHFGGPGAKFKRLFYRIKYAGERRRTALASVDVFATPDVAGSRDLKSIKDNYRPDLLLINVELHEYIFTAHHLKMNFKLLSQWYSLWDQPGLPYLLTDTVPGQGFGGSKLGIFLHWQRVKWQRFWMFRRMKWITFGVDRRSILQALARKYDFPKKHIRKNFWPGPFTYTGLPVLSMTPLELEFPHRPPPWLTYIGPMVYHQRKEENATSINGNSLDNIFARQEATGAKLIVCTVSTLSTGDVGFLQRVMQAVAARPDWLLIIGLGGKINPQEVEVTADNVFPFTYLPQLRCLRRADLSINHGGIHTIHECLDFKVAMLIYSGKRSDQPGCAARVHYHGLGLMADKDVDDVATIQRKIAEVLEDGKYQAAVNEMHARTRYYGEKTGGLVWFNR